MLRAFMNAGSLPSAFLMFNYQSLFDTITSDPRYLANLDWGQVRSGHPEGTIRAHIAELERNLDHLRPRLTDAEFWKLRILVHTHDLFKGEAKSGTPITDPRSHASLARAYLETFDVEPDVLNMVQYHDEPYALWRQFHHQYKLNAARLEKLLATIQDWDVFLTFLIVDGCTAGKTREPLHWFFEQVAGRVESRFTSEDIIEQDVAA